MSEEGNENHLGWKTKPLTIAADDLATQSGE